MGIWTAGRVVISKPVNQCNLRVPANDGRHIDGFGLARLQDGNNFKLLQDRLNLRRIPWLRCTNYNIFTSLAASAALVEHLVGLADPTGIAEEHFELSASLPTLFQLDLCEQLLRAGSSR